jgi:predicted ester cyclase
VVSQHRFTTVRRLYGPNLVIDESDVTAIALQPPFGLPVQGGGHPFRFRLLHVFELRDGLISREQAWFDTKAIERQLPPA